MSSQEFISIAAKAGCEVHKYERHWVVKAKFDTRIAVTVPDVAKLVDKLVKRLKATLGL